MSIAPISLIDSRPAPKQGTFHVKTWGCQMNEEDSEQIARHLESIGFTHESSWTTAQILILNTCSVRKKPEDKAFSLLGEIELHKRRHPNIVVGVCGCMAQIRSAEIRTRAPFVDFVVGTGQISTIPGLVEESIQSRRFRTRLDLPERKGAVVTDVPLRIDQLRQSDERRRVKAFVPIQYGCDKFCSFCIVPSTRGRERSRPTEEIVAEVRSIAAHGAKEVTLLGQTVNSYGKNLAEGRVPFSKLLWLLEGIPGLERIRYTSPYPRDFKVDLIECIRDNPKVMEHVHLPLQSGDDAMLATMKRQYTKDSFLEIVSALRKAVPSIGLTTDIIVGYPGETEEQFDATMDVVETVRFDGAYMFIYSPRPGTPAAELPQLPYDLKHGRLKRLAERQNEISIERNKEWVGRTVEVLVEGPSPKDKSVWQGYSREFKMVHFPIDDQIPARGELVAAKVDSAHLWGLGAKLA